MHKLDLTEPIPADFKLPPLPKRNRADQARINGAKSQGPITEDGKFICSRGALKHGLTALKHTVLDIEDPDEFLAFQTATIDEFRPKSVFALSLVEQLAHLQWTLDRLNLIHTSYLNHKVNEAADGLDPLAETAQGTNEIAALVRGWIASAVNGSAIDLLRRYTATLQHQFNSTFNNLHKLEQQQAARLRDRDLPYQIPGPLAQFKTPLFTHIADPTSNGLDGYPTANAHSISTHHPLPSPDPEGGVLPQAVSKSPAPVVTQNFAKPTTFQTAPTPKHSQFRRPPLTATTPKNTKLCS